MDVYSYKKVYFTRLVCNKARLSPYSGANLLPNNRFIIGHYGPAESVIRAIVERFRTRLLLADNAHPKRCRRVRTEYCIDVVEWCAQKPPYVSIRPREKELEEFAKLLRRPQLEN